VRDTFGIDAGDAEFQAEIGRPLVSIFERWAIDEAHRDALVAAYRAHNDQVHDAMVAPFPGMPEALQALRDAGIPLGIVTSKARSFAERGLRVTGLQQHFAAIVAAEDTHRHKPDPEPVALALRQLGWPANQALMVGDAGYDLLSGRAAGAATAGVLWGGSTREALMAAAPDHLLSAPADLAALCLSRG
jgi:pyrophosphatase PpaX